METIKNYLEAMFANMPNTESVKKAKADLSAMMEDKYTELINEGKSENEAVGTVIAEFGNLDELAEELGVKKEVEEEKRTSAESPRRLLSFEEVSKFVERQTQSAMLIATGVFLCIISVNFPIFWDIISEGQHESLGAFFMFICIFTAVFIFVYNAQKSKDFEYILNEPCKIDKATADHFAQEKKRYSSSLALTKSIGIALCAACWLPAVALSDTSVNEDIGALLLFIMVGIGVFMIVSSAKKETLYKQILTINDSNTISGDYGKEKDHVKYDNPTVATIMSIYWPSITCIYLIWSFTSFDWAMTWIIWPIAAVAHGVLKSIYANQED